MNTTQKDVLQEQMNASGTNKESSSQNEQLVERIQIEGTPFHVVRWNEDDPVHDTTEEWRVAIGRYLVSDSVPTREIAELKIKNKDWDLMLNVMMLVASDVLGRAEHQRDIEELEKELDQAIQNLGKEVPKTSALKTE